MKYRIVKGMSDIYLSDVYKWQFVEQKARSFFGQRLYEEIRTPIVEYTELFTRSIGETTDIVNKEMYSFRDRGNRSLTLRPEMTASIVRSVIENNLLSKREPLKLFYYGPMFRAERPQAGRRRQFFQIGVEVIGNDDPFCDAEVIKDLLFYLEAVGLKRDEVTVQINNVGGPCCRPGYLKKLKEYFSKYKESLCNNCKIKYEKNILRIFDCKNNDCIKLTQAAPKVSDEVCSNCKSHFDGVSKELKSFGIPFVINKSIVRGLDYYTSTVFEVTSNKLGAKDAIAAGGRYNDLMKELGGENKAAVGFAIGVERLLLCLEDKLKDYFPDIVRNSIYVAYSNEKYIEQSKGILARLENMGFAAYADLDRRSLNSQLKRANKFGFRWVLILNKEEVEQGIYTLKDLRSKDKFQCNITERDFANNIQDWIK